MFKQIKVGKLSLHAIQATLTKILLSFLVKTGSGEKEARDADS